MNNCGKRFHSEAAKFRFLNELIKVLTPKVRLDLKLSFKKKVCFCACTNPVSLLSL